MVITSLDNYLALSNKVEHACNLQISNSILGVYTREILGGTENLYEYVHINILHNNKTWKKPNCLYHYTINSRMLNKLWNNQIM